MKLVFDIETIGEDFEKLDKSTKAQGVTGDDVARLFKEKKFKKIAEYNVRDLYATKELYEYWDKYLRF